MRIQIVGGGPGGLYLALLTKQAAPSCDVTVYERDAADETFGWGVVFSEQTFSYLRDTDRSVYEQFRRHAVFWDHLDVVHRGQRVRVRGTPFAGIARLAFVRLLRQRCADAGVALHCRANVRDLRALPDCDLLVGADGANSLVRRTFAESFQPGERTGGNMFAWMGVRHRLEGYTLALRATGAGVFAAHLYPHSDSASTAVIECAESTWARAGLNAKTDHEACTFLSDVFADELSGHLLLTADRMKWRNFLLVTSERWTHQQVALLGDAAHTVHFSTGLGTRLALEDAIALFRSLQAHGAAPDALVAYEAARRPEVARVQDAARESLLWFEHLDHATHLTAQALTCEVVTKAHWLDDGTFRALNPELVAAAEPA